ncbi:MAG: hypothetical protein ACYCWE_15240 [Eubacteriales bacterium]
MLTIFNRRELTITFDMKRSAEIRTLLAQNGIAYSIKVINRNSPSPFDAGSRARTGSLGVNQQIAYEYIVYVRKSDYEKSAGIIDGL